MGGGTTGETQSPLAAPLPGLHCAPRPLGPSSPRLQGQNLHNKLDPGTPLLKNPARASEVCEDIITRPLLASPVSPHNHRRLLLELLVVTAQQAAGPGTLPCRRAGSLSHVLRGPSRRPPLQQLSGMPPPAHTVGRSLLCTPPEPVV